MVRGKGRGNDDGKEFRGGKVYEVGYDWAHRHDGIYGYMYIRER